MTDSAATRRPGGIYYGWYVLAVVALGAFLAAGLSQLLMATLLQPMTEEFGWSRTAVTGAVSAGTMSAGLLAPWIGRLADRYGPRPLTTAGALIVGGSQLLLAALQELWQLYAVFIVGRAVCGTVLAGVVPSTAATNWFRRVRGRALGLVAMAIPLGVSSLVFVARLIIDAWGWRAVFVVYGLTTILVLVPLALVVLRRRPEDIGLRPDGDPPTVGAATPAVGGPATEEGGWSLGEAQRTRQLWLLIGANTLGVLANTAVGFHMVPYYISAGIPATEAVVALSVYSLFGAFISGFWGWLTEYLPERMLAIAAMLAATATVLAMLAVQTFVVALLLAALFGITSRGEGTLMNIIVAQYFGRRAYGTITGFMSPFQMVGLGLGPLLGSIGADLTGAYTVTLLGGAAALLGAGLCLWLAPKPHRAHAPLEPA